jgi:hypothetical protein
MNADNLKLDNLIKDSGLKNPSEEFTSNILKELPEELYQNESKIQVWMNNISGWIIPSLVILAGLVFIYIKFPLPNFTIPSYLLSFSFDGVFELISLILTFISGNIIVMSGLALLGFYILIELIFNKVKSFNFIF